MIISPPILKPQTTQQIDEAWIDSIMPQQNASLGEFPILDNLAWHGGYHLHHTDEGSTGSPVRAIADGVIVYARASSGSPANGVEPLAYNGVTDNGCVVIQHATEIGDQVSVTYYSIYMHMKKEASYEGTIRTGQKVYRKQAIGLVGQATHQNMIHFEIICDQENLEKLVGRNTPQLDLSKDGRKTVVYGDIHFYLPKGKAKFYANPHANSPPIHTSEVELYVALRFAKGAAILTTRQETAQESGIYKEVGNQLDPIADYEYDLYKKATDLATHTIAASATYELLRFGRIIDTSIETSNISGVEHWHKVNYPGGTGYVNLNDPDAHITKFSDGDFPHWLGWRLVDDDPTPDSQCNSPILKKWLDTNGNGNNTHAELTAALDVLSIQDSLSKAICNFPTEWTKSLIDTQYSWLKLPSDVLLEPLTEENYTKFKAYVSALSFWEEVAAPATGVLPPVKHWHFHPREFIKQFRKCGWLSKEELAQCLPRRSLVSANLTWATALSRSTQNYIALNKYFLKYLGASRARLIQSLAQIYIETGLLGLMNEGGSGNGHPYTAFYGRGYLQLTWASNYENYGAYKKLPNHIGAYIDSRITSTSMHPKSDGGALMRWHPRYDPSLISGLPYAGDSSGFYWVTKHFKGTTNINKVCDLPFTATTVGFTCWLINGGNNGYEQRQQFAMYLVNILFDFPLKDGNETFRYPSMTPKVNLGTAQHPNWVPPFCTAFPPVEISNQVSGTVYYDKQTI
jgi:predicted chitinase